METQAPEPKKSRLSKLTILFTIVAIGLVGLLGVFKNSPVDTTAFSEFVKSATYQEEY